MRLEVSTLRQRHLTERRLIVMLQIFLHLTIDFQVVNKQSLLRAGFENILKRIKG